MSTDQHQYILNVSGGKDSTAMLLWAMEKNINFTPVFSDTGNEHPITLDYIRRLPHRTGCPEITWVKADFSGDFPGRRKRLPAQWEKDGISRHRIRKVLKALQSTGNPFLDLCLLKGRFPSFRARFCSSALKNDIIHEKIIMPFLDRGKTVVTMLGIRAEESKARSEMPIVENLNDGRIINRPLLHWPVADVFSIHKRHNVEPNPLYKLGCHRVSCMPCFMERKASIRNITKRFPEQIDRIALWEQMVKKTSKQGDATFFPADKTPGLHQKDKTLPVPDIRQVAQWSMTGKGGRVFDPSSANEPSVCSSQYGLCE